MLVAVFLAAMSLAVLADNLGVIWVAIEATTVATAFLVGHRRTRTALEATWKYVIICSVGIACAFLGTVLLYFAARHAGGGSAALNIDVLLAHASRMDPAVTRLAAGLLLIGYGAKAGLVPFHTWLADAHSQAPAPVSALMSGVLLAVAFSALLRVKSVVDLAIGKGFLRAGLITVGLLTLLIAASLLVAQRDLKRMLAYSSMENMGFLAIAAAVGTPLAITALLLQVLAHGIAKTVLFLSAGQLQSSHNSTTISDITAVLVRSRLLGGCFAVGMIVLLGFPPFAMFASELSIARSLADTHLAWVLAAALLCLVVAFAALVANTVRMLLGPADGAAHGNHRAGHRRVSVARRCRGMRRTRRRRRTAVAPVAHRRHSARRTLDESRTALRDDAREPPDSPRPRDERTARACSRTARRGVPPGPGRSSRRRPAAARRLPVPGRLTRPARRAARPAAADEPRLTSLAGLSFPASRFEREMADLYGISLVGHPAPRRLVRHAHWPEDWHPMRRDAGPAPEFTQTGSYPFVPVEGPGVYEIPVGPVHAGLIEPGHFRFSVVGETILKVTARLWFVHRGVEKLFETRDATDAVDLAERISGDTSAAHALAHTLAIEDALRIHVPDDVHRLRALLIELERLYNHAADLGALANDVGFGLANAHAQHLREELLRINDTVTGHRLLRGAIHPGGITLRTLPDPDRAADDRSRPRRDRPPDTEQQRHPRPVHRHRNPHPPASTATSAASATSPEPAA